MSIVNWGNLKHAEVNLNKVGKTIITTVAVILYIVEKFKNMSLKECVVRYLCVSIFFYNSYIQCVKKKLMPEPFLLCLGLKF